MAFGDETRKVVFEFIGDTKDLKGASKDAEKSLGGVEKGASGAAKGMHALKAAAPLAAAAAGAAAAKWALDGIKLAETGQLIEASFNKTFGPAADDFIERNEEMRLAMGLSEQEFQKQVTAIGAVSLSLHQTEEEAAQFAEDMLTVAADVAAFNGDIGQSAHVVEAMNSALIGNTESLEAYGIEVTQAMVVQQAMADTGKAAETELTQLEKRTATMTLITQQAALMQGSLNEAVDAGATKQNELNAKMKDAQQQVGEALLPLKVLLLEALIPLADILVALAPLLEIVGDLIGGLTQILQPVIRVIEDLAKGIGIIVGWLADLIRWLGAAGNKVIQFANTLNRMIPDWARSSLGAIGNAIGFHTGGVVPGARGQEVGAVLQAGERVIPANQTGMMNAGQGGGAGMTNNITVNVAPGGDPMETARQIADLLESLSRTGTPINIETGQ